MVDDDRRQTAKLTRCVRERDFLRRQDAKQQPRTVTTHCSKSSANQRMTSIDLEGNTVASTIYLLLEFATITFLVEFMLSLWRSDTEVRDKTLIQNQSHHPRARSQLPTKLLKAQVRRRIPAKARVGVIHRQKISPQFPPVLTPVFFPKPNRRSPCRRASGWLLVAITGSPETSSPTPANPFTSLLSTSTSYLKNITSRLIS